MIKWGLSFTPYYNATATTVIPYSDHFLSVC